MNTFTKASFLGERTVATHLREPTLLDAYFLAETKT
jgi:hypothetical protein